MIPGKKYKRRFPRDFAWRAALCCPAVCSRWDVPVARRCRTVPVPSDRADHQQKVPVNLAATNTESLQERRDQLMKQQIPAHKARADLQEFDRTPDRQTFDGAGIEQMRRDIGVISRRSRRRIGFRRQLRFENPQTAMASPRGGGLSSGKPGGSRHTGRHGDHSTARWTSPANCRSTTAPRGLRRARRPAT